MPRIARVVFAGVPHHITQRGNRRADVFWTDDDRQKYLEFRTVTYFRLTPARPR
jgi:putative transposase